jgi:hypothetical protein
VGQLEIFSAFRSFTVELGNLRPKFEIHDEPRPKTDAWEVGRSSWMQIVLSTTKVCSPTSLQLGFSTYFKLRFKSEAKLSQSWATMKRPNLFLPHKFNCHRLSPLPPPRSGTPQMNGCGSLPWILHLRLLQDLYHFPPK